ncbi:prolipoprotein diacylglyceryl transferase [Roseburia sp. CAG:309]|nr:prolipoprotein diacylglyceryl transferase [Roseburia sp. CAG:309]
MNSAEIAFPNIGIYIPHLPKGITIGGFTIAFYGMIIAAGMLSGLWLACHQAQRTGQKKEVYTDFAIYAIIFSLIGARLYYVVFSWENYKDDLLQIFNTRGGGMAIYGAVIAAVLTAIIYCKVKKYNFFLLADTAVGGLVLGQIIGRYGNFFNREAFGEYTNSLFAMRLRVDQVNPANITELMRSHMTTIDGVQYIQVHPTFLYESLWNILVLVLILVFTTKKKFNGEIFLLYLVGYALGRVWIEGLRTDQLQIGSTGIAVSQVLSGAIVIVGVVVWICVRRKLGKKILTV